MISPAERLAATAAIFALVFGVGLFIDGMSPGWLYLAGMMVGPLLVSSCRILWDRP